MSTSSNSIRCRREKAEQELSETQTRVDKIYEILETINREDRAFWKARKTPLSDTEEAEYTLRDKVGRDVRLEYNTYIDKLAALKKKVHSLRIQEEGIGISPATKWYNFDHIPVGFVVCEFGMRVEVDGVFNTGNIDAEDPEDLTYEDLEEGYDIYGNVIELEFLYLKEASPIFIDRHYRPKKFPVKDGTPLGDAVRKFIGRWGQDKYVAQKLYTTRRRKDDMTPFGKPQRFKNLFIHGYCYVDKDLVSWILVKESLL